MMDSKARTVTTGGLLLALGVLFPQVFHLVGGPATGGVWLPMHIPVLLAGCFLGPWWGLVLGGIAPCLGTLFLGMPTLARLPFMVLELAAYGFFAGLCLKKGRLPLWVSLPLAQLAGRLVYALSLFVAGDLLQLGGFSAVMAWSATLAGLPGLVLQWVLVPLVWYTTKKAGWLTRD